MCWSVRVLWRTALALALLCGGTFGLPDGFVDEQAIGGISRPVKAAYLNDGSARLLVGNKRGEIFLVDLNSKAKTKWLQLQVDVRGEMGLLDFVLSPDFARTGHVWILHCPREGDAVLVTRYTHTKSTGTAQSPKNIWSDPDKYNQGNQPHLHYGGSITIGPEDGHIYITLGDKYSPRSAQNMRLASGKILRIDTDGDPVPGNMGLQDPAWAGEIYAQGLRNPYRASWDVPPGKTARLLIGEVGGNDHSTAQEDLHLGRPGVNYGWPACEGSCKGFDKPLYTYPHFNDRNSAIIGGEVYRNTKFPTKYQGGYFYGDYPLKEIRFVALNGDGTANGQSEIFHVFPEKGPTSVHVGPDGWLYVTCYLTNDVRRIRYTRDFDNVPPRILSVMADETIGDLPLTVTFDAVVVDDDGDKLVFLWRFGDGQLAGGQTVSHTYTSAGTFIASLEVTDSSNTVLGSDIRISAGAPGKPTITSPADGQLFNAGEELVFKGALTGPGSLVWEVEFSHDDHTHPISTAKGSQVSLPVPTEGHGFLGQTGYRVSVYAVNNSVEGEKTTIDVYPRKRTVTLLSEMSDLRIEVDGLRLRTPTQLVTAVAFRHEIVVPRVKCEGADGFAFSQWEDGNQDRKRIFTVPTLNQTLIIGYSKTVMCKNRGLCKKSQGRVVCECPAGFVGAECEVEEFPQPPPLVKHQSLVLHFDQSGVEANANGAVLSWTDSVQGFTLRSNGVGKPRHITTPLRSELAVRFDGRNDGLVGNITPDLQLPAGAGSRTMIVVGRFDNPGRVGVSFGDTCRTSFGVGEEARNFRVVNGCNSAEVSAEQDERSYAVHTVVVASRGTGHRIRLFQNSKKLATQDIGPLQTNPQQFFMGTDQTRAFGAMRISEVLLYSAALNYRDREAVEGYLLDKYFDGDE